MRFEEDRRYFEVGKRLGFVLSYLLFTTILFLVLALVRKHPMTLWSYATAMAFTAAIATIGLLIRRWLQ